MVQQLGMKFPGHGANDRAHEVRAGLVVRADDPGRSFGRSAVAPLHLRCSHGTRCAVDHCCL